MPKDYISCRVASNFITLSSGRQCFCV